MDHTIIAAKGTDTSMGRGRCRTFRSKACQNHLTGSAFVHNEPADSSDVAFTSVRSRIIPAPTMAGTLGSVPSLARPRADQAGRRLSDASGDEVNAQMIPG